MSSAYAGHLITWTDLTPCNLLRRHYDTPCNV